MLAIFFTADFGAAAAGTGRIDAELVGTGAAAVPDGDGKMTAGAALAAAADDGGCSCSTVFRVPAAAAGTCKTRTRFGRGVDCGSPAGRSIVAGVGIAGAFLIRFMTAVGGRLGGGHWEPACFCGCCCCCCCIGLTTLVRAVEEAGLDGGGEVAGS